MSEAKSFPIISERHAAPHPLRIPWSIAELAYSTYAKMYGRGQTMERLAERGGFYPSELDGYLPDWRERCSEITQLRAEQNNLRAAIATPEVYAGVITKILEAERDHLAKLVQERNGEIKRLQDKVAELASFASDKINNELTDIASMLGCTGIDKPSSVRDEANAKIEREDDA